MNKGKLNKHVERKKKAVLKNNEKLIENRLKLNVKRLTLLQAIPTEQREQKKYRYVHVYISR